MARAPPRTTPTRSPNAHSPPCRRYIWTMLFAMLGAFFALFVSTLENRSIDHAVEKHFEEQKHLRKVDENESMAFEQELMDARRERQREIERLEREERERKRVEMEKENEEREKEQEKERERQEELDKDLLKEREQEVKDKDSVKERDQDEKERQQEMEKVIKEMDKAATQSEENESSPKEIIDPSIKKEADSKKAKQVKRLVLLGERNTGTRWMSTQLQKCFPSLKVTPRLLRWKHWFQTDDKKAHNPTLVIAQFRNLYEWVEAMRNVPHHAPNHLYLDWKTFVTREWGMKRPRRDEVMKNETGQVCYEKFKYNELISCVEGSRTDPEFQAALRKNKKLLAYSGHKPIYELRQDGSGKPFENILEMRAAKIRNHLDVKEWDWVVDSIPVRYERLLKEGTDFLLTQIEETIGLKRDCEAEPPQTRKKRKLTNKFVEYLNEHADWEAEGMVGYEKWGEKDNDGVEEDVKEEEEEESKDEEKEEKEKEIKKKKANVEDDYYDSYEDKKVKKMKKVDTKKDKEIKEKKANVDDDYDGDYEDKKVKKMKVDAKKDKESETKEAENDNDEAEEEDDEEAEEEDDEEEEAEEDDDEEAEEDDDEEAEEDDDEEAEEDDDEEAEEDDDEEAEEDDDEEAEEDEDKEEEQEKKEETARINKETQE